MLPVMLHFRTEPLGALWFLQIATISMLPLLALDQLVFATIVLTFVYLVLIRITILWLSEEKASAPLWDVLSLSSISDNKLFICLFYLSTFVACPSLLIGQAFIQPPQALPFLFPLLLSAFSCGHFVLFFIYFNIRQIFYGQIDSVQGVTQKTNKAKSKSEKKKHV